MQKYCLTKDAQKEIKETLAFILGVSVFTLGIFTFPIMIIAAIEFIADDITLPIYLFYYGISIWIVLISFIPIYIYKWIIRSFEKC